MSPPNRHPIAVRAAELLGSSPLLVLAGVGVFSIGLVLVLVVLARWMSARGLGWRKALFRRAARAVGAAPSARARLSRLVRLEYELVHLGLGLALLAGLVVFVALAVSVVDDGAVAAFDESLARAVHRSTPPELVRVMLVATSLGGGEAVLVVAVVVAVGLLVRRRWHLAIGWITAEAGAGLFNALLKSLYRRARPTLDDPFTSASGWSFPSGHSMGTIVTAGMLAYVFSRFYPPGWPRFVAVFLATLWTLVIGFSRVCLGVHYASDVLGGFAAGAVWLVVCVSGLEVALRPNRSAV
ncbi:MAG: phosphatase PAP2 family protein [Polyangiaceae bacterium]